MSVFDTATRRKTKFIVAAVVVLGGLAVRSAFFGFQSGDYNAFFARWYDYIAQNGGFRALKDNFANYNVPYLYLLTIVTYLPVPALFGIKAISVLFDLLLAFFTYRIVAVRRPGSWWPLLASAIVLYLPTVVLNSSAWAQVDSAYSSLGLGGVYFVLRRRPWLACLFFGLAFSFKLQVIFLFPALLLFVLRGRVPWRALLVIPAVYLVLDIPALLVGANFGTLISVYFNEASTYDQLTLNAPNVYQFLGNISHPAVFRAVGIALTAFLVFVLLILAVAKQVELTTSRIVLGAAVSALLVPFFLPAMHERYFYLADALTVIAAFYLPRRLWPVPLLEQFASGMAYAPFLSHTGRNRGGFPPGGFPAGGLPAGGQPARPPGGGFPRQGGAISGALVDFKILAAVMLAALALTVWATIQDFRDEAPATASDVDEGITPSREGAL